MGTRMILTSGRWNPLQAVVPVVALLLSLASCAASPVVSVRDYGAKGDGKSDDTAAFSRALARCDGELFVPPGRYRLANLHLPDGTTVRGVGVRSTITMSPGVEEALLAGNDCTLTDLRFVGASDDKATPVDKGIILLRRVHGVALSRLTIEDSPRAGIFTDHADHFRVADSRFRGVAVGVNIVFSHYGLISGNFVDDAKMHGMQFWGNWQFEQKDTSDLVFTGNVIHNVGAGGIWGTGAARVVMSGNSVDGAGDVGLDYEWCDDSSIVGNTVRDCKNAGISLFFGCMNVTIAGNALVVTEGKDGERHGIWLTDPDRPKFPKDLGHRFIAITGNSVRIEGPKRHAVYIGADSHDVTLSGNMFSNGDILDRTGRIGTGEAPAATVP